MESNELASEIDYWRQILQTGVDDRLYELAFFSIFVKFEQFMIEAFIHYSTGGESNANYRPQRKLNFQSFSQLQAIMVSSEAKKYIIEKSTAIGNLSKHIFEDNDNPFEQLFDDALYSQHSKNMRVIRNYIAHRSEEALTQYKRTICGGINKPLIKPYEYLLQKPRNARKTHYTIYIELLGIHTEIIFNYLKEA